MSTPNHLVVHAVTKFIDRDNNEQSRWTRIGAAFPNSKGGFRIVLELLPANLAVTDIVAMPPKPDEAG